MQAPAREAMLDRPPSDAELEELRSGDDPVLALRKPRDAGIHATHQRFDPDGVVILKRRGLGGSWIDGDGGNAPDAVVKLKRG